MYASFNLIRYAFGFADLTDGKKISESDQVVVAKNLKKTLESLDGWKPAKVLIEQQPGFNMKSCSIRDRIIYHFCTTAEIEVINPLLKNKIARAI